MESQNKTNPAYPSELKDLEDNLLKKRRGSDDISNKIGFGLSGGGIRSATFCLGIFQGLAKQELPQHQSNPPNPALKTLLSKIDFLSTVSGGGFFGSFYGRLFTRDEVANVADVADILSDRAASEEDRGATRRAAEQPAKQKLTQGRVFRWLRANGRYTAPSSAGNRLFAGVALIRNLIAVQMVLATFVLMIFLFLQLIRGFIEVIAAKSSAQADYFGALWSSYQGLLLRILPGGTDAVWWSTYALLPAAAFLFLAVPPLWSYWLVENPNRGHAGNWISPIWGIRAVIALSLAGAALSAYYGHKRMPLVYLLVFFLALETRVLVFSIGWKVASRRLRKSTDTIDDGISGNEDLRLSLSTRLERALVFTGVLLALFVIDSFAQTAYAEGVLGESYVSMSTAALAPLIALSGFAWRIFAALWDRADGKNFDVPLKLVAGITAVVISALLMLTLDVTSYAIAWNLRMPPGPHPKWTINYQPLTLTEAEQLWVTPKIEGGWTITTQKARSDLSTRKSGSLGSFGDLRTPAFVLAIAFVMSILFGWSWQFLNRSIYTSRLIRAYLGASNPARLSSSGAGVTQAIPGDDIPQEGYWPRYRWLKPNVSATSIETAAGIESAEQMLFRKGAPLHLVNVTINETLDAESQIEQQDRKGLGMAVGPAAISAGVVHHLVLSGTPSGSPSEPPFSVYPPKDGAYRIFRYRDAFNGELLSLGNWTGISGAAFSTSLGSRSSLGFSTLADFANGRLSYWWNSGVEPLDLSLKKRWMVAWARKLIGPIAPPFSSQLASQDEIDPVPADDRRTRVQRWSSALFQLAFGVQRLLFDELFARFHGTARQWWPLSDGGHFENMGGYELIRRRLDVIVIVDAEADPDYTFSGMANLVRKARLDFGAEIRFLTEAELDNRMHSGVRKYFGTLEQLRRWIWIDEPVEDPDVPDAVASNVTNSKRKRRSIKPVDKTSLSLAHAALATVTYNDERPADGSHGPKHWLLYIKPTLVGDEPSDVRQFQIEHPSFPNESTAEQFFDEAQWESYRRLGEHIADKVFRSRDDQGNLLTTEANRFFPYRFGT
jgi:hypothetical protein